MSESTKRPRSKWDATMDEDVEADAQEREQRKKLKREKKEKKKQQTEEAMVGPTMGFSMQAYPEAEDVVVEGDEIVVKGTGLTSAVDGIQQGPTVAPCRHVDEYEQLNVISEGTYGKVFRGRDRKTGEIVAIKKLKLKQETNGFPITSLREIHSLMLIKHKHIVNLREVVVGDKPTSVFLVMDFIEHDLKLLMEDMPAPFLQSEVKTLMLQLLSAIEVLHRNWIIHRDLKTSNLLMNNQGEIKVADFGLARMLGDPPGNITPLVVTLWYRAPELLLGATTYTTALDMWSIGCIFAELVNKEPLFPGRTEIDQLNRIFKVLGKPNPRTWPGLMDLPGVKAFSFPDTPPLSLRPKFPYMTEQGIDLMSKLLTYDPEQRITAKEALQHPYFREAPLPKDPALFPTFPSKGAGERRARSPSPSAPVASHGLFAEDAYQKLSGYEYGETTSWKLRF